jgi:hypothetical protein
MQILILWLILRLLTSLFAGFVSSIKPMMPIENAIPFLPPTPPWGQYLERVFLSPWLRWDAEWYQRIVVQGYSPTDGTAPFHPLYPWLATPLARIGISPILSLLIISSLAGIALFYIFSKLIQLDLQSEDAFFGLMLFALAPPSFVLFAPYSESLFLLFAVLCLFWARKKSWWLAGLAGGLAVLTRQQGIFLLFPMAWELFEDAERKPRIAITKWKNWFALILIPVGMLIWLAYRAIVLSDIQLKFDNFQGFIYSVLISPSAMQGNYAQQFVWPWQALIMAFQKLSAQPDLDLWVNIIGGVLFLVMLAISWRKMRLSYRIYSFVITFVSFSYYTGPVHPYMGLLRHLLLAFPVFVGLAGTIKKPWIRLLTISASAAGMLFLIIPYVLKAWVP